MSALFLSSEEYDERAHQLYSKGDYHGALEVLKEGLSRYPQAVDLCVGLGYARLAREEYAWARHAFERAVLLDEAHEDALVGLGETLLRFGEHRQALRLFDRVVSMGLDDDVELMLTIGRALYRAALYTDCYDIFSKAAASRPDSADAAAALGYTLHRLGDEVRAGRQVRRALRLNPDLYEARIFLGHLFYDRGDWEGSLRELEQVPPQEHWDPLAVWRLMELKRTLWHVESGDPRLAPWEQRLNELEEMEDPIDRLLADVESRMDATHTNVYLDPSQLELFELHEEGGEDSRMIRLADGHLLRGDWAEIIRQMRDQAGFGHETVQEYMRRLAERWLGQAGVSVPSDDPEHFLRAAVEAGLILLELEE